MTGRDKSAYKMVEEDLSYFIKTSFLENLDEGLDVGKPGDLSRIISMHVEDTSVEIIYDAEKLRRVLNSNLSAPTQDFPVALVGSNTIDVFPEEIGDDVVITYYRYPVPPLYSVTQISDGFAIEDTINSIDFELPDHYLTELVGEIARMIGVRLRDDVLMQYGVAETTNR